MRGELKMSKDVYVIAEQRDGKVQKVSVELIGEATKLAKDLGEQVVAVLVGSNVSDKAESLIQYGADKVIVVEDPMLEKYATEPYAKAITAVIKEFEPEIVLYGASSIGRDLAPRVSARVHTGLTADCTKLDIGTIEAMPDTKLLLMTRPAFGGNIMRLLVSSESIYEGTMEFLDWRIYGFFFSFINVMFRALYIGITRTKVLTINAIVMALTNVVLDYALIFGKFGLPEMGIKGAAIASVLAEASSILFFVIYTYATVDLKKYGMNRLRTFDPALLMRILSISCFTMLQYFLSMATWFVFFVAVERLGQRELAIANIVRSIYVVLLIPVNALATTTNSLVSNAIGAGGIQHVMPLINKIARFSFFIMLGLVAVSALFPQFLLSIYTSEAALITESVPSVYVICFAMLIASVANVVFNGISGTGNTQAALLLETITIIIYGSYIIFIGMWLKAPIEICFTIEIVYYSLLLITSYIYLKKAKWQNKKI